MPRHPDEGTLHGIGDAILFIIGASAAVYEFFFDRSSNPYIYALIVVFVKGTRDGLELLRGLFGR